MMNDTSSNSNFYEQLVEHSFISEILQEAYLRYGVIIEVLHSEIDCSGYDIVLECNGVIRHIQLKTSKHDASTQYQKINISLGKKPSGCVIWIKRIINDSLKRFSFEYLFFGSEPGEKLPNIKDYLVVKHTKGNAQGVKSERPNMRKVPKHDFQQVKDICELLDKLFGIKE